MNAVFRRSFTRDLRKNKQRQVLKSVQQAIENVEASDSQSDIANLKKLVGYETSIEFALAIFASVS